MNKKRPIFQRIAIPVVALMLLEIIIFVLIALSQGFVGKLQKNASDVVREKIISRSSYVENYMVHSWMNLGSTVYSVNEKTEAYLKEEKLLAEFVANDSNASAELLEKLTPDILSMIQHNQVTGGFLVLNTEDLEPSMKSGNYRSKYGLYLKNNDPKAQTTDQDRNVLMERSPISVVHNTGIPMDSFWDVNFDFAGENRPYYDWLYKPFQLAYKQGSLYSWRDMGRWSGAFSLEDKMEPVITYSVPLMLRSGKVYGVLGIEIGLNYLKSLLENEEIGGGTYFLALKSEEEGRFDSVFGETNDEWMVKSEKDGVFINSMDYYVYTQDLNIYENNTPFSDEQWVLAGVISYKTLYSFERRLLVSMGITILLTLLVSLVGSLIFSYHIQVPISKLVKQIQESDPNEVIHLDETGITEIDSMSEAITELSRGILLDKQILTYERDHDSLTGLYNRGAFHRKIRSLFNEKKDEIKIGVFMMFDLDNLKFINDTYGHEYGDKYISAAAGAMREGVSGQRVYARISGDEFNVFLYGNETKQEAEERIERLGNLLGNLTLPLPDGSKQQLHASGGVAWYPFDSEDEDMLAKYADHAMYMIKKSNKGGLGYFDKSQYKSREQQLRYAEALTKLIANEEVYYALQPIVSTHTGEIYAYEALLRPKSEVLTNVGLVLETARQEGKLHQIEELTWKLALKKYDQMICDGKIAKDACIFINSIPNQRLGSELRKHLFKLYGKYGDRIVLELTEDERVDGAIWMDKQESHRRCGGRIALDDYGSGYNGESNLIEIAPEFIKIDISIIKDIHENQDKQDLMEYMVHYAHSRKMLVIAEGVEKKEELKTVIGIGVDLIQGYYLAMPKEYPSDIDEEKKQEIKACK